MRKIVDRQKIPLSVKIVYTAFMAILIPAWWINYGPSNFLWISDITLILAYLAVLFEKNIFASMAAVGGFLFEAFWTLAFFLVFFFNIHLTNLADYMFDPSIPLWMRTLSLFHIPLPFLSIWLIKRLGYFKKAVIIEILLTWSVLIFARFFTNPDKNINWVFSFKGLYANSAIYPFVLGAVMALTQLITHVLLVKVARKTEVVVPI